MKKSIHFIFLVLVLISCDNKKASQAESISNLKDYNVNEETNEDIEEFITNYRDTIIYSDFWYPHDTFSEKEILLTDFFHGDEVSEAAENKIWFGLFKNDDNFYLKKTSINVDYVYDLILDEDNEKTGKLISVDHKDTCFILIEDAPYLTENKVDFIPLEFETIYPEDSFNFTFLNKEYLLYATGSKKKVQSAPDWFEVWNYELYLSNYNNESLLASIPMFNDNMISFWFAGDIDGDNHLDLIIDLSNHYNAMKPTVFLSVPSQAEEIIVPVGFNLSVGC